jgi:universal stress protein A
MKVRASEKPGGVVVELKSNDQNLSPGLDLFHIKHILVPIDFSESSRKAVRYAVSFAKLFQAELLLVHVLQTPTPIPGVMDFPTVDEGTQTALAQRLSEFRDETCGGVTARDLLVLGSPFNEISRVAEEQNIDLIVLGTHGHSALHRLFLGSTAERVLRYAPCPVLVVREKETDFIGEKNDPATTV